MKLSSTLVWISSGPNSTGATTPESRYDSHAQRDPRHHGEGHDQAGSRVATVFEASRPGEHAVLAGSEPSCTSLGQELPRPIRICESASVRRFRGPAGNLDRIFRRGALSRPRARLQQKGFDGPLQWSAAPDHRT